MAAVEFTDVADDVGLDFRHGAFRWDITADVAAMMGGGVCWIDVDRDGWLDLFVTNTWSDGEWGDWRREGALPTTRLFRNEGGHFVDATDETAAGLEVRAGGCVAADLDLDGWTDLYVTSDRVNQLLWNDGGTFVEGAAAAGVAASGWQAGAAAGDLDGDGRPDLFVTGYTDVNRPIPGATKGFPNTFQPEPDLLYLNQGPDPQGRVAFREVAREAGIEPAGTDYGLGALLTDADLDGDLDVYVANDTNPNRLYLNESSPGRPSFIDAGPDSGADDDQAGMGVAAGDYDHDGAGDLVVTNLDGQGHRVLRHRRGAPGPAYENVRTPTAERDLLHATTGWGTTWADLDLDGDLDLLIANGAVPVTDLAADREPVTLLEYDSDEDVLSDAAAATGLDRLGPYLGRGLARADFDNDGDPDFALATVGGPLALLRTTGAGGHWLGVEVDPATPGTRVSIRAAGGTTQWREIQAGSSYLSSEDPRARFGLGGATLVEAVTVDWPDGTSVTAHDVGVDRYVAIASG